MDYMWFSFALKHVRNIQVLVLLVSCKVQGKTVGMSLTDQLSSYYRY